MVSKIIFKKNWFVLFLITILGSYATRAQQYKPIKLDEAITKGIANNTTIKIAEQDYKIAKANYLKSNAILLPKIVLSNSAIATNNPLNSFGFKLLQQSITQADFALNSLNHPDKIENYSTKIEVQQPLVNLDGLYQRKAAKWQVKSTSLQKLRTKDQIVLEIKKVYMQLQLAYAAVDVLSENLKTAQANLKLAQNNYNQGYLQKADVLNVEIYVSGVKTKLQYAKSSVKNVSDFLSFLIGENRIKDLKPTTKLIPIVTQNLIAKNFQDSRADIQAVNFQVKSQEQLVKSSKMQFLPRANAFYNYEFDDSHFLGSSSKNYIYGLQFTWSIFNGSKNIGAFKENKALLEKVSLKRDNYIENSKLELNKTKRKLIDAKNKLNLSNLAVKQAKEALRIRTNRFKQGLEKTTDLLNSESKFAQMQLKHLQSIFEFNYTTYYLKFLLN